MILHLSALVPLAVTLCVFSEITLTSANKTVPCDKTGCKTFEFCDESTGKCNPHKGDCPCEDRQYCNDYGKCIEDTPCDNDCPPDQECYLQQVQCFTTPCPPIRDCRPKCPSECPDGSTCDNGECVSKCAKVQCKEKDICHNGGCFKKIDCGGKFCKTAEKCYVGRQACSTPPCPEEVICRPDRCALMRCASGKCEDDHCVPNNI